MKPAQRHSLVHGVMAVVIALSACVAGQATAAQADARWRQSSQMVLVVTPDWNADHGVLRTYERQGEAWKAVGEAQDVTVGRSGAAWGLGLHDPQPKGPQKHEGDGRATAGVFRIGEVFGYAGHADTRMPYDALQVSEWCVDVDGSPYYNQIVDANKVGAKAVEGSSEPMRRDLHVNGDQRYKLGFVIEQNPEATSGGGSCIFAHLWKSPTDATAGCTAMPESAMRHLLAWLKPEDQPVFVLLPQDEYVRLQSPWHLPAPGKQP
ncbi:MAG TPA: L,D-transpeptidase family protein [Dyella sp.]|uniref:L,D-transpeptidase family protein n=1 Tax=Dyella sp. TaxID=1869338 RepID=UPI002D79737A|nr:L,D-transpeptidase family protein [Dyella sp.]HET6551913.1 L,D-transpeptidase family protein [Dyella sp.]